ncbi:MAG TPA: hypothetical protein VGR28_00875 [Candidatus Thermoplasmatota archaeon]|jgi:hypothetical protein|nr:hypothetical protein [Candidatus Thermoplasmatota archaeon]
MAKQFDESDVPEWGLYADENRRDLTSRKSIKVKLPIRQHIKLHALKLFSENNISQTVEAALDMYFDRMRAQELASRAAVDGAGATSAPGGDATGAGAGPGAGAPGTSPGGSGLGPVGPSN